MSGLEVGGIILLVIFAIIILSGFIFMIVLMHAIAGFASIPLALMDGFANGKVGSGPNRPGMFGK